jgi:hypothetical protein
MRILTTTNSYFRTRGDAILLFAASVFFSFFAVACCGSFDSDAAKKDNAAQQWLHRWQETLDWTDFSRWRSVKDSELPRAESLLRDSAFLPLTEAQAIDLTSESTQSKTIIGKPYLLRGVGSADRKFPQEVYVRLNGDVWVGGGANSRCPVPMERRAVIAWLDSPPREVYITFVVAK